MKTTVCRGDMHASMASAQAPPLVTLVTLTFDHEPRLAEIEAKYLMMPLVDQGKHILVFINRIATLSLRGVD